ncbi:methionine aminopeptidase 1D, mitochondrial-like [Acanthaster planci]|uniref:Methionine aminopeptidase n=1 Tax=Acanthaster planci TaxID=133434 RepID=A0A8B8A202_ACAPL|nr:methionine aminopeptidase 1D, mitochondrial-like [Acanthaster planci]
MAAPTQAVVRRARGILLQSVKNTTAARSKTSVEYDVGARLETRASSTKSTSGTLLCPSCGSNRDAQQTRTFFGLFKNRRSAQPAPVVEDELPYKVVRLGNVSARRSVPKDIMKPEYALTGVASAIYHLPILLQDDEMEKMREAGKMARKILDIGASHVKPGVTTDRIDEAIHAACLENNVYPSTLNYKGYPKSVCTSVNNVMVHGIPDDRALEEGDMINIDFTVFMNGYHGDVSETYAVGTVDEAGLRLIQTARRCRDEAIKVCEPVALIARIGGTVQKVAQQAGFYVCPSFVGHGIGKQFHCKPDIWHYANAYPEKMMPGMAFTIEPVVMETPDSFIMADDGWTVLAKRHTRSAQFEHTILITDNGVEVPTASSDENFEREIRSEEEGNDSSSLSDLHQIESPSTEGDQTATGRAKNLRKADWKFD